MESPVEGPYNENFYFGDVLEDRPAQIYLSSKPLRLPLIQALVARPKPCRPVAQTVFNIDGFSKP